MSQIVTGSIATDHLMVFPGRFTDQLVEGKLDKVALSFLVDELRIHRGGIGANVAFGMSLLGLHPILVGAAGADFGEYRRWLEQHGVDTSHVLISQNRHTARFLCTTDAENNQIASFYAGAMSEARDIDLAGVIGKVTDPEMIIICPDDPAAMLRHTRACRSSGLPYAADPSQQIARMDGTDLRELVDGAHYLFTNEYEQSLLIRKTGWSSAEILQRVGTWVVTTGPRGAVIETGSEPPVIVKAASAGRQVDPTGVGDAFRAGFLAGISWHLTPERGAQLGCVMATLVLETAGTQEYTFDPADIRTRMADAYGPGAADEVSAHTSHKEKA
ncbi:MAG TPA: carbohydrate kinase family protein [Streptosporangiaceae bacterium]|jgi:adenosine kinase